MKPTIKNVAATAAGAKDCIADLDVAINEYLTTIDEGHEVLFLTPVVVHHPKSTVEGTEGFWFASQTIVSVKKKAAKDCIADLDAAIAEYLNSIIHRAEKVSVKKKATKKEAA